MTMPNEPIEPTLELNKATDQAFPISDVVAFGFHPDPGKAPTEAP